MGIGMVGLLVVTILAAACSAGGAEEVVVGNSAADRETSTSSAPASTATVSTDSSATSEAADTNENADAGEAAGRTETADTTNIDCDNERYLDGDFDGDGIADRAYYDEFPPTLFVCSAEANHVLEVGNLEILVVADVDRDGRDELLAGATTAWGQGVEIVALVDGRLDFVTGPTGEPLALWRGLPPGRVLANGCGSFSGDGSPEIAAVEGAVDDAMAVTWERTIYRLDGHQAVEVLVTTGSLDTSESPDPLTAPAFQALVGEPC